ncbi:MAG: hypothetical protein FWD78_15710 [Treponema sp.]|nr:hypothetical protein [Treponema sp.]
MKRFFVFLFAVTVFAAAVYADDKPEPMPPAGRQYGNFLGPCIGIGGMKNNDGGILTADAGISYSFYLLEWLSLDSGLLVHLENYWDHNYLTGRDPLQTPLCFTVPFGMHFNVPNLEMLYCGFNLALNIPITDMRGTGNYNAGNLFISIPLDLGFDFINPASGGSRLFLRVTPEFHKGGFTVPIGIVWQIHNWKIGNMQPAADVHVEVNVPPPPVINIEIKK